MGYRFNCFTGTLDITDKSPYKKMKYTVPALTSAGLDIVPLSKFSAIDYSASFKGTTSVKGLKLFISKSVTGIKDQVFAKSGDSLNIQLSTSIAGTDMVMTVSNLESFAIDVTLTRALL
jgi:hypothetical protein